MIKQSHFYTCLMVIFFSSCKAHLSAIKIEENSIQSIFVQDTLNCSHFPNNQIEMQFLVIKHPNCDIENKINSKLLSLNKFTEAKPYSEIIKDINFELENACLNNSLYEYETIFKYESIYIKNNILGILRRVGRFQDVQFYFKPININLKTGEEITSDKIFKMEKKQALIKLCNSRVQNTINKLVISAKENRYSNDSEYIESVLEIFDKNNEYKFELEDISNFVITEKENTPDGIEFVYSLNFPWAIKAYEPDFDLFFTFKELQPFLKKDFKKTIGN